MGRMSERTTLYHLTEWRKRFLSSLHPLGLHLTVQEIAEAPSEGEPGRMLKVQSYGGVTLCLTWAERVASRHTTRGDCGLEDADKNLELVEGSGVARQREDDESPSGLAAPIHVTLPDPEE